MQLILNVLSALISIETIVMTRLKLTVRLVTVNNQFVRRVRRVISMFKSEMVNFLISLAHVAMVI
jgi:hypothetical protein